jgi:hypothetical protein
MRVKKAAEVRGAANDEDKESGAVGLERSDIKTGMHVIVHLEGARKRLRL